MKYVQHGSTTRTSENIDFYSREEIVVKDLAQGFANLMAIKIILCLFKIILVDLVVDLSINL